MNRILRLIQKDARRFWSCLLLLWAVMQLACYPASGGQRSLPLFIMGVRDFLIGATPLLCGVFVVIVIQQESLIGDRQYWLTRPFGAGHLVGSKVLFILLTVNLPLLVFQSVGMAIHGLSPFEHLSELLWRQIFFTAFLVVAPVAAIWPRSPAHSDQHWLTTLTVAPWEFQISLDRRKPPPIWSRPSGERYSWGNPNFVQVEIPVRVSSLANGDRLIANRLQPTAPLRAFAPGGFVADNTIHDVVDGAGWLRLFVEATSYASLASQAVDLKGTADFILFVQTQTVNFRDGTANVPGVGVCDPYPLGCYTALARASVAVQSGGRFVTYVVAPNQTYDPFPTSLSLTPVRYIPTAPGELVVRKPVDWFTRSFEFRDIRLADFVR
jgi:hypothetical protein